MEKLQGPCRIIQFYQRKIEVYRLRDDLFEFRYGNGIPDIGFYDLQCDLFLRIAPDLFEKDFWQFGDPFREIKAFVGRLSALYGS